MSEEHSNEFVNEITTGDNSGMENDNNEFSQSEPHSNTPIENLFSNLEVEDNSDDEEEDDGDARDEEVVVPYRPNVPELDLENLEFMNESEPPYFFKGGFVDNTNPDLHDGVYCEVYDWEGFPINEVIEAEDKDPKDPTKVEEPSIKYENEDGTVILENQEGDLIFKDESGRLVKYNQENDSMEVISFKNDVFGSETYANCDWNYNDRKFINPHLSQDERRRKRVPLTEIADEETLFSFLRSLLTTALQREWEVEGEEKLYVFDPYNPKSYLNLSMDSFSTKSHSKEIGIRSKLDELSINVVLSCLYVLYSRFKKTSDEIIFEETYREGVLMQDSSFNLAKYYDKISTDQPANIGPLTSLMSECLDLVPFADRELQFDVWRLTYSKHTKKVVSSNLNSVTGFLSIEEILEQYSDDWFRRHKNGDLDKTVVEKVVETVTKNINLVVSEVSSAFSDFDITDQLNLSSVNKKSSIEMSPLHSDNKMDSESHGLSIFDKLEIEASKPIVKVNDDKLTSVISISSPRKIADDTRDEDENSRLIFSAPPTPVSNKNTNKGNNLIDSVFSTMSLLLGFKQKKH